MPTNSDVIDRALRKLNVIALGVTTPAADQANALVVLQALYGEWYGMGVFGRNVALPSILLTDNVALGPAYFDGVACVLAMRLWTDYSDTKDPNPSVEQGAKALEKALLDGQGQLTGGVVAGVKTVSDIVYGASRKLLGIQANSLTIYQLQIGLDNLQALYQDLIARGLFGKLRNFQCSVVTFDDEGPRFALAALDDLGARNPYAAIDGLARDTTAGLSQVYAYVQSRICCDDDGASIVLPTQIPQCFWDEYWGDERYGVYAYAGGYSASAWWGDGFNSALTRPPHDGALIEVVMPSSTSSYIYEGAVQMWVDVANLTLTQTAPMAKRYYDAMCSLLAERMAIDLGVTPSQGLMRQVGNAYTTLVYKWDRSKHVGRGVIGATPGGQPITTTSQVIPPPSPPPVSSTGSGSPFVGALGLLFTGI